MALSRTEIVKRSEEKHGIKLKAFKLPLAVIADIEALSQKLNKPQNQLIIQAVELLKKQNS